MNIIDDEKFKYKSIEVELNLNLNYGRLSSIAYDKNKKENIEK